MWDVATGMKLRTFQRSDSKGQFSIAFSPDGMTALSGGLEGELKLWDVGTSKVLFATLISFNDGTWVASDQEGHYDASNGGDNPHLHWMAGNKPVNRSQIKRSYYAPGLIQKVMGFDQQVSPPTAH